jgi:cell wall assembly regulator SMI1
MGCQTSKAVVDPPDSPKKECAKTLSPNQPDQITATDTPAVAAAATTTAVILQRNTLPLDNNKSMAQEDGSVELKTPSNQAMELETVEIQADPVEAVEDNKVDRMKEWHDSVKIDELALKLDFLSHEWAQTKVH